MTRSIPAISLLSCAALVAGTVMAQPPGGPAPGGGGPPNPLLQAFDTDRDGTLSAAEIDAAAAKLRERDANKDGKLTADELRPARTGMGTGGGMGGVFTPLESGSGLEKPPLPRDDGEKRILQA